MSLDKARKAFKEEWGEDGHKVVGRAGGLKTNPNKGFGSDRALARQLGSLSHPNKGFAADKEKAREAGRKGAARRWGNRLQD